MMKKLFRTDFNLANVDILLLFLRILIAGFMLTHGLPKMSKLLAGGEIQFADIMGLGAAFSLALAVFAEVVCSILIGIGSGTRVAAVFLIVTMLVAALIAHGSDPFGKKELSLLYFLVYTTLLVLGSGKYSLDHFFTKTKGAV